jgi:thiamine biosynthesis protein ThiS
MDTIKLEINGEMKELPPVANVKELLQFLDIGESQVALELNRKIIRRTEWETTPISNFDHVEIVQFVGGG